MFKEILVTFNKALVGFCLIFMSIESNAAINEQGLLNWDTSTNFITVDGSTDRYIELSFTKLLTYQQTLDAIANDNLNGGVLAGFKVANQADAYVFFNRYTLGDFVDDPNVDQDIQFDIPNATSKYQNGLLGDSNSNKIDTVFFLSNRDENPPVHDVGSIKFASDGPRLNFAQFNESLYQLKTTDEFALGGSEEDKAVGWLLVSNQVSSVPEPSTIAMLCVGLLGVMWSSRRHSKA